MHLFELHLNALKYKFNKCVENHLGQGLGQQTLETVSDSSQNSCNPDKAKFKSAMENASIFKWITSKLNRVKLNPLMDLLISLVLYFMCFQNVKIYWFFDSMVEL